MRSTGEPSRHERHRPIPLPLAARSHPRGTTPCADAVSSSAVVVRVRLQGVIFGTDNTAAEIVPKVLVDMFVYNPVSSAHTESTQHHMRAAAHHPPPEQPR